MLTDLQTKIIELSKREESLKEQLKTNGEELDALLTESGVGSSFQDPTDNVVFEVVVPKGRFVYNKTIGFDRTKREGERSGALSMKRAKELGFTL
tara:strand:- start:5043 stop:5327 length:285 start_codon:yes stop_codon:yes gene_type:complete